MTMLVSSHGHHLRQETLGATRVLWEIESCIHQVNYTLTVIVGGNSTSPTYYIIL